MNLGKNGEILAAKFLEEKGFEILDINYHSRFGEIDIIARDKLVTVFVEVKSRSNTRFGYPLEAITQKKLSKMIKTAQFYLLEKKLEKLPYRFDAIEVFVKDSPIIKHVLNITL